VLGYVTPWNGAGKDAALRWAGKLTHVSPCWYQLRNAAAASSAPAVVGRAEADAAWVTALQAAGVRVVPRFALELDGAAVGAALRDPTPLARAVADEVAAMGYDGAVLDGWAAWAAGGVPRAAAAAVFRAVAAALHASGGGGVRSRQLVLAVPPAVPAGGAAAASLFTRADFAALTAPAPTGSSSGSAVLAAAGAPVDLLSLMTYDAGRAAGGRPAPNAPLSWVGASLTALLTAGGGETNAAALLRDDSADSDASVDASAAARLLVGLNFYGYDFAPGAQPEALLGRDVTRLLAAGKPKLHWSADAAEHYFDYTPPGGAKGAPRRRVYYPTPASIQARACARAIHACATCSMACCMRACSQLMCDALAFVLAMRPACAPLLQRRLELAARTGAGVAIWELGQGQSWFFDLL
jgi:hypothetical protein